MAVWLVLGALMVVSVSVAGAEGEWCGGDTAVDWVCPMQGTVYAAKRALRPELPVPINGRRLVTSSLASARLSWEDKAYCSLGELSEILPGGLYANSIFTQRRGSASCWSDHPSRARIACGRSNRCSTELRADGSFLFTSSPPTRAAASTVKIRRQRIRIVSCEGFVEVTVDSPAGRQRASGGGTAGSRLVIEIVVISKRTEKPWGIVIEEVARITSETEYSVLEECESSAVQEAEETVRP